jgi:DNA-binding PadR family transcriptional regulator
MPNRPDRDPQSVLPLRPIDTLILTMLADGDRHGYAIRQEIMEETGGKYELEAGNLYRYMRGLEEGSMIELSSRRPGAGEDPRRVYYKLTSFGRRVLAAEMQRMRELVALVESRRITATGRA